MVADLARIGENALTLIVLIGIGWWIYSSTQNKSSKVLDKVKDIFGGGFKKV